MNKFIGQLDSKILINYVQNFNFKEIELLNQSTRLQFFEAYNIVTKNIPNVQNISDFQEKFQYIKDFRLLNFSHNHLVYSGISSILLLSASLLLMNILLGITISSIHRINNKNVQIKFSLTSAIEQGFFAEPINPIIASNN
jgi:hypothetical protein